MRRSGSRLLIAFAIVAGACTDPAPLVPVDGAIVVGDALPFDPDAEPRDASVDTGLPEAGPIDTGEPPVPDATTPDVGFIDAGTVCDEASMATVTATSVLERADMLAGQIVTLIGTATAAPPFDCSNTQCGMCCESCTASVRVGPVLLVDSVCGIAPSCQGIECQPFVCSEVLPFERRYRGFLRTDDPLRLELIVAE